MTVPELPPHHRPGDEGVKLNPRRRYLRAGSLPHFFCSGCGAAQVLNCFVQAADELDLDFDKLVAIGGVGCTARIPVYLHAEALHGVHGRTLPWATGIKLHNPELEVVIFSGDGDAAAIGGNHLIQAARRNVDVTMIVVNNLNFAMTGGQVAPTTFLNLTTSTTPYGNPERPFDLCKLAVAAGATFVARWTTHRPRRIVDAFKKAIQHKGFALVEIITQCPTYFGRRAMGSGDPVDGVEWIAEHSVTIRQADQLSEEELADKFVLGTFVERDAPVFEGSSIHMERGQ
jgi:2-oxoglutarate/2-oxoacid ferredoxin oxidoreductase subunit beta